MELHSSCNCKRSPFSLLFRHRSWMNTFLDLIVWIFFCDKRTVFIVIAIFNDGWFERSFFCEPKVTLFLGGLPEDLIVPAVFDGILNQLNII